MSNDSLTSLHVASTGTVSRHAHVRARMFPDNKITAKGAMALCDALKKNVKLTDLNIAGMSG